MNIELRQRIENKEKDIDKTSNTMISGISLSSILKKIKLSGKQICDLKNYGVTTFYDEYGSLFTIELTVIE